MMMADISRERPMHVAPPLAPTFTMPDPLLPQIRRLEALAARAWPSRTTHFDGGWAIRLSDHDTKRQNAIVPLDPDDRRDLDTRIAALTDRFAQAGRRVTFRLTPLAHPAIDEALAARGWEEVDTTHVMTADLGSLVSDNRSPTEECPRRWVEALSLMNGINRRRAPTLVATLERIAEAAGPVEGGTDGPAHLHILREDDEPAATALAVHLADQVGLMEVFTAPERRGRGHGRRIVAGALAAARSRGAKKAWLQVGSTNAPALALYRDLGFETFYDYHYRVAPLS